MSDERKTSHLGVLVGDATPPQDKEEFTLDFSTFILSIATTAMIHLGLTPAPDGQTLTPNFDLAKHNIDILSMLEQKTKDNLTEEEHRLLQKLLYDLRILFVEAKSQKSSSNHD